MWSVNEMLKATVIVVLSNRPLNFDYVVLFILKSALHSYHSEFPFTNNFIHMKSLSAFPHENLELSTDVETDEDKCFRRIEKTKFASRNPPFETLNIL